MPPVAIVLASMVTPGPPAQQIKLVRPHSGPVRLLQQAGLVQRSYMALRWVLSIIVIVCLVSVLIVLAFGGHVLF